MINAKNLKKSGCLADQYIITVRAPSGAIKFECRTSLECDDVTCDKCDKRGYQGLECERLCFPNDVRKTNLCVSVLSHKNVKQLITANNPLYDRSCVHIK